MNEISHLIRKLMLGDQRLGQIFKILKPEIKDKGNSYVVHVLEDYLDHVMFSKNEVSDINKKNLIILDEILSLDIPFSNIVYAMPEDTFHTSPEDMYKELVDFKKDFIFLKEEAVRNLDVLYNQISENDRTFDFKIVILFQAAYGYNDAKNIWYGEFFDSRSYFLEKAFKENNDRNDILKVAERIISLMITNQKIHTMDLYRLMAFSQHKQS